MVQERVISSRAKGSISIGTLKATMRPKPIDHQNVLPGSSCAEWGRSQRTRCDASHVFFHQARIDNRDELIRILSVPEDVSDSTLLLRAYQRFGPECAQSLYGDFAFAIWDGDNRRVFAARDTMGCQPVYYSNSAVKFTITEHLSQLVDDPHVSTEPDEAFIAASLLHGFAHHERTHFAKIRKIPAGHFLIATEQSVTVQAYWRPEEIRERTCANHDDCLEEFRGLVREAVRARLPNVGRTGVHVSGGLDCSSLALLAGEELNARGREAPVALSWYPPPGPANTEFEKGEYERITSVCDRMDVKPVYTTQSPDSIRDVLSRDHMVRPICNATYNEWQVQQAAKKQGVTTILSGFGGDEAASFNGRGYFQRLALTGQWRKLSQFAGKGSRLRFCASNFLTGLQHLLLSDNTLKQLEDDAFGLGIPMWKSWLRSLVRRGRGAPTLTLNCEQQKLHRETLSYLNREILDRVTPLPPVPRVRLTDSKTTRCHLLRWSAIVARIESWAADGALRGIRYSYPLLDRRVVEFALSLPGHVFRSTEWNRLFFRQAMEPLLPPVVCWETSKFDPARSTPLIASMKQAYSAIGTELKNAGSDSPKSKYLDLNRLIRDLDETALANRERMGRLVLAMEFLGTESLNEHRNAA